MARRCDLISKHGKLKGNKVSHSKRKTIRHFLPNLQNMEFSSDILQKKFKLKISVKTSRTILKCGGLDNFLLSRPASKPGNGRAASKCLTDFALKIRRKIKKEMLKNLAIN
jgi:large subunit ribosomal protein L28